MDIRILFEIQFTYFQLIGIIHILNSRLKPTMKIMSEKSSRVLKEMQQIFNCLKS